MTASAKQPVALVAGAGDWVVGVAGVASTEAGAWAKAGVASAVVARSPSVSARCLRSIMLFPLHAICTALRQRLSCLSTAVPERPTDCFVSVAQRTRVRRDSSNARDARHTSAAISATGAMHLQGRARC